MLLELDQGVKKPIDLELDECMKDFEEHEQRVDEILKRIKSKTDAVTQVKENIALQESEAWRLTQQIENEKKKHSVVKTVHKMKDLQLELEKEVLDVQCLLSEIQECYENECSETTGFNDYCQRIKKQFEYFFKDIPVLKALLNLSPNLRQTMEMLEEMIYEAGKLGEEIVPSCLELVEPLFNRQVERRQILSLQDKNQATQLLEQKSAMFSLLLERAHQSCLETSQSQLRESLTGVGQISEHISSQLSAMQQRQDSRKKKSVKKEKVLPRPTNKTPEFSFVAPSNVRNSRSQKVFKTPTPVVKPSADNSLQSLDNFSRKTKTALKTYQIQQIQQTNLYINRRYTRQMNGASRGKSSLK